MVGNTWISEVRRFPNSLNRIEKLIKDIDCLDLEVCDYEDLKEKIKNLTNGYVKQEHGWKLNTIFRARKNENGRSFSKFNEVFSPPEKLVRNYGRFNCPKMPIFYAAEVRDVIFYEIKSKPGDIVTISQYEPLRHDKKFDLLDFAVYETICAKEVGFTNLSNPLERVKRKIHPDDFPKQQLISEFIVREVTRSIEPGNECRYKITAAIAEVLWDDSSMFDMISYPSITKKLKDLNVAFFPHLIQNYYRLSLIQEVKVLSINDSDVKFDVLKEMKSIDYEEKTFTLG